MAISINIYTFLSELFMIKRLISFFSQRPSSTPIRTEIETVTNPMSDKLLIGVSIYASSQEPRSQLEKSNTWECMSDMSDDLEVLNINLDKEDDNTKNLSDVSDLSGTPEVTEFISPSNSRLLMTPSLKLTVNEKGLFSVSPDGVEDLDEHLDDSSSYSGLSPIIM